MEKKLYVTPLSERVVMEDLMEDLFDMGPASINGGQDGVEFDE